LENATYCQLLSIGGKSNWQVINHTKDTSAELAKLGPRFCR
jgi:hypothetical protein